MTTITFKEEIWLNQKVFTNVSEFLKAFYKDVDFREEENINVSQNLLNKVKESKNKNITSFDNI